MGHQTWLRVARAACRETCSGGSEGGWASKEAPPTRLDRVNHEILMDRLAKRIADKGILRLIRRYLQAGIIADGVVLERSEGTPQGSPRSPLLSNVLLDGVDKGAGAERTSICTRFRRLQHVCSESASRRSRASINETLLCEASVEGERSEDCGMNCVRSEVSGVLSPERSQHRGQNGRGPKAVNA